MISTAARSSFDEKNEEGAMKMLTNNRLNGYLALGTLIIFLLGCMYFLPAIGADSVNPRADFWRTIRHGVPGYTAVSSDGHAVLIQHGGENWREIRNVLLIILSPWVLAVVLAAIAVFHLFVGGDKLKSPRSGVMIARYSLGERLLHWYTALFFIILAITGLSLLLGRSTLIPILGHAAVAAYLSAAKGVHNVSGPLFLAGVFLEFVIWFRQNIFHKTDLQWLKNMGGMIGGGPHPHSGKINGGEKMWFWLMVTFGTVVGGTGILLDFPIWGESRFLMQVAHVVHTTVAVLFVTASFGHIYMGTIGSEGAFQAMWQGEVDTSWAKQHADLWYEEVAGKE
jgi:formate dehydrogenase subunit gamma